MVRVIRVLKVGKMTRHARSVGQTVIGVRVALAALQGSVRPGQRPARGRVIECGRRPRGCVVTDFTLLRETRRDVIRIVGSLEILQVTTHASRIADVVVSVQMTLRALHARVGPGQREAGLRVIERCRHPCRRAVAHLALLRDARGGVIGIRSSLKVF